MFLGEIGDDVVKMPYTVDQKESGPLNVSTPVIKLERINLVRDEQGNTNNIMREQDGISAFELCLSQKIRQIA